MNGDLGKLIKGNNEDAMKRVLSCQQDFELLNGKLYRIFKYGAREVPAVCKRKELVRQLHLASGHVGSAKLYGALRQAYYWPSMWQSCVECVTQCVACQK